MSAPREQIEQALATVPFATAPGEGQSLAVALGNNFACQWVECSERCLTAKALFDHVCERHVGRKSTKSLNLTCRWGQCRVITVKRDHLASHIRVHMLFKPHSCNLCSKSFKRPQDLKKHVKTHADDSVLCSEQQHENQSPEHRQNRRKASDWDHSDKHVPPINPVPTSYLGGNFGYHSLHHTPYYAPQNPFLYGNLPYQTYGGGIGHDVAPDYHKCIYDALTYFVDHAKRCRTEPCSFDAQVGLYLMSLRGSTTYGGIPTDYMRADPRTVHIQACQNSGGSVPEAQYSHPMYVQCDHGGRFY